MGVNGIPASSPSGKARVTYFAEHCLLKLTPPTPTSAGFIHIPSAPSQRAVASERISGGMFNSINQARVLTAQHSGGDRKRQTLSKATSFTGSFAHTSGKQFLQIILNLHYSRVVWMLRITGTLKDIHLLERTGIPPKLFPSIPLGYLLLRQWPMFVRSAVQRLGQLLQKRNQKHLPFKSALRLQGPSCLLAGVTWVSPCPWGSKGTRTRAGGRSARPDGLGIPNAFWLETNVAKTWQTLIRQHWASA